MSITSLVSGAFKRRQADIETYAHHSEEIQRRVLAHLVQQGQRTLCQTATRNHLRRAERAHRPHAPRRGRRVVAWCGEVVRQIVGNNQRQKQIHPRICRRLEKHSLQRRKRCRGTLSAQQSQEPTIRWPQPDIGWKSCGQLQRGA